MKKSYWYGVGVIVIIAVLVLIYAPKSGSEQISGPNVKVTSPLANTKISSPLTVTGEAHGWYFEASFPVKLLDANGKVIASAPAQAQEDWTQDKFIPFKATLTFPKQPSGSKGTLVLSKDNPSGRPETEGSIQVPVVFK
jgi:hypothetical protein